MSDQDLTNGMMQPKYKRRLRWRAMLLAVAMLSMVGIGTVYALSMHQIEQVNNLQSHSSGVVIDEVFPTDEFDAGTTLSKKVSFRNTSSSPVFLRVAYTETWQDGTVWLQDDGSHVTKNWTSAWSSDWWSDGQWYYYKKVLPAGGSTDEILASVSFPAGMDADYAKANYSLSFMVEAVQMSDEPGVNSQAISSLFVGRTATLTITGTSNGKVTAGTVAWS